MRFVSNMSSPLPVGLPRVAVASHDPTLLAGVGEAALVIDLHRLTTSADVVSSVRLLVIDTAGEDAAGLERLRALRRSPAWRESFCVVLAEDEDAVSFHADLLGADDAERRALDGPVLRRRVQGWVRRAEEGYAAGVMQSALDASVNGICIADARERGFPIIYVSKTFERMTGYPREECIGRNCGFLQHADTDPEAIATLRSALATGTRCTVVLSNRKKDGTELWNELTLVPVHDAQGRVDRILGIQHDVTALVAAERLHRDTVERSRSLAALLDGVEALVAFDARGHITFANRPAEELLGAPVATLLGAAAKTILDLPDSPVTTRVTYPLQTAHGQTLEVELSPRKEGADDWVATLRATGARARLDDDRKEARRLVALGSMTAGLSHEIRNPLATMSLLLGELAQASEATTVTSTAKIKRQLDRVIRIVRDTSLISRPHPPRRIFLDARNIVTAAVEGLASRVVESKLALELDLCQEEAMVFADEKQLVQLLSALVNNALEAARSRVVIGLRHTPAATSFTVSDDGPGIPEETVGRIFDPFFTTKSTGTGLGLSIAKRLAEEHRAELAVITTSRDGTVLGLTLTSGATSS